MPIPVEKDTPVRLTARERVYKALREWIVTGILMPNERLNDMEIAKHFSVSRTPVREALQMLSEQKLVTMIPSSGTFVAPLDPKDLTYVYELLGILQSSAIDLSISRIGAETLNELKKYNSAFYLYSQSSDTIKAIQADREFHHQIAVASKNPYITTYTDQLMLQAHRNECRFFKDQGHCRRSYDSHSAIIDALTKGDAETAKELLRQNWKNSVDGI